MMNGNEVDILESNLSERRYEERDHKNPMWKQGDVVFVDLGEGVDIEQAGVRPCVIIQNDSGNKYSTTTIVAPITKNVRLTNKENVLPTHYIIEEFEALGLNIVSTVLCEQIRTVSKNRILYNMPIGKVGISKLQNQINAALGFGIN